MLRLLMRFLVLPESLAYKNVNAREIIQEDNSLYHPPVVACLGVRKKDTEDEVRLKKYIEDIYKTIVLVIRRLALRLLLHFTSHSLPLSDSRSLYL